MLLYELPSAMETNGHKLDSLRASEIDCLAILRPECKSSVFSSTTEQNLLPRVTSNTGWPLTGGGLSASLWVPGVFLPPYLSSHGLL